MEVDILIEKGDLYLVPEVWTPYFKQNERNLYLVQKYGG